MNEQLKSAIQVIEKAYGKGSVFNLKSRAKVAVPVISTSSLSVDDITGIGGIPRGRITEIYGPESGGKSTLCLHIIAEAQKAGDFCAYIDAEHSIDPKYAESLGVDLERILVAQPSTAEEALEIADFFIKSGGVDVVVIDSVAALVPKAELEGEMGQATMALTARIMAQAMRKLTAATAKSNTALIFINQVRDKIGVMFGSPETTTGGKSLKFFASLRMDIRRVSTNKIGDEKTSNQVKVKIVKNKMAAPFRETEITLIFGKGISKETDILNLGIEHKIIEKSHTWIKYNDERFQGEEKFIQYLIDNPKVFEELDKKLRILIFGDKNAKE